MGSADDRRFEVLRAIGYRKVAAASMMPGLSTTMPPYVMIPRMLPGAGSAYLGVAHKPLTAPRVIGIALLAAGVFLVVRD